MNPPEITYKIVQYPSGKVLEWWCLECEKKNFEDVDAAGRVTCCTMCLTDHWLKITPDTTKVD